MKGNEIRQKFIEYFEKNGTMGKSEREALNSIRNRKTFKQYGKNARGKVLDAINQLCQEGSLICTINGQTSRKTYKIVR